MAKAPVPGQVKTRLVPPLTPQQAARIAADLLKETAGRVKTLQGIRPEVAVCPASGLEQVRRLVPGGFSFSVQPEGDLGDRIRILFDRAFAAGAAGVLVLGADHPGLPTEYLQGAVKLLSPSPCSAPPPSPSPAGGQGKRKGRTGEVDRVVLGPTEDGGYYGVGLTRPHPELFEGIPWSTGEVLRETVRRARALRLAVELLPAWTDLDRPEDLERYFKRNA